MGFILFRNKNTPCLTEEGPFLFTLRDTEKKGKNVYFKHVVCRGEKHEREGGVMTVTIFDRHIRLQKEHPARG